jgi:oligopeptide transport system permease protein
VLAAVPTLFVIVTVSFFLMRLVPGGPFDADRLLPPEVEMRLAAAYDLDKPVHVQYGLFLKKLLSGDLGPSFKYADMTVVDIISSGIPVSATLGLSAIFIALLVGIPFGTIAALRQNSAIDYGVMSLAMTGIAVPSFVIAPLLSLVIGVYLGWLPVGGWGGGSPRYLVLPILSLSLPYIAYVARLTRGAMIETLHSDYVRTARAKGLSELTIIRRHAMPSALLPVVSFLGPAIAGVMTGSVVVEQIFDLPGLGRFFVQGSLNRDYTLVMGVIIFYSSLVISLNILVDVIYGILDPRARADA